ncbi:Os08g0126200 [Oryza sativa Japonica Group]|uniref:Os08g0126200 protein n=1 Tax=Oryza sativa subsp. japonica TaxID=39947 RepID=A0A0N7KP78_ORYSJ|nr:Os08g0126200 [Oryza sativa Japonica Group]
MWRTMPSRTVSSSSSSSSSSRSVAAGRSSLGGRGRRLASPSELAQPAHEPALAIAWCAEDDDEERGREESMADNNESGRVWRQAAHAHRPGPPLRRTRLLPSAHRSSTCRSCPPLLPPLSPSPAAAGVLAPRRPLAAPAPTSSPPLPLVPHALPSLLRCRAPHPHLPACS